MKKPVKITLITLASIIGLVLIVFLIMFGKYFKATKQMTPAETYALNDSVYCIKDNYVNAFIFKTNSGYLMIDAGMRENHVLDEMQTFDINANEITTLLLTHSDGDHIGATGAFKNASVWLHTEEEQMINGTTAKMGPKRTWKFGDYNLFNSDDVLEIEGLKVKVIHTPGHTPGSCCFVINDDYLVTGDNLLMENDKYAPFVEQFTMDPPLNAESIKNLPDPSLYKYVLTAHGGVWRESKD